MRTAEGCAFGGFAYTVKTLTLNLMGVTLMAKRRKRKLVSFRGPRLGFPSFRIGGRTGVNVSRKGISVSTRTKFGTISSRKGKSTGLFGLFRLRK